MMKKRFMAMLLAISMIMGLSSQAFAANQEPISNSTDMISMQDANGNDMEFSLEALEDGTYLMRYFYNGVLDTEYILDGSQYITAKDADGYESVIDSADYLQAVGTTQMYSTQGTQKDFCTIKYQYSSYFGCVPTADIDYSVNTQDGRYKVTAKAAEKVADVVAVVTGGLISMGISLILPAALNPLLAAVIDVIASTVGSKIVDGVITAAFSDYFDCTIDTYEYHIAMDVGATKTVTYKNAGEVLHVYYEADDYWETLTAGYLPDNIPNKKSTFAKEVWDKTFVGQYPGYDKYVF